LLTLNVPLRIGKRTLGVHVPQVGNRCSTATKNKQIELLKPEAPGLVCRKNNSGNYRGGRSYTSAHSARLTIQCCAADQSIALFFVCFCWTFGVVFVELNNAACKNLKWSFSYVFLQVFGTVEEFKTTVRFSMKLRWLLVLRKILVWHVKSIMYSLIKQNCSKWKSVSDITSWREIGGALVLFFSVIDRNVFEMTEKIKSFRLERLQI